jgi:tRNA(fMet)-specific endonuclease VapC
MYLLDTTHCSLILKDAQSGQLYGEPLRFIAVATTAIVAGELFYMAQKSSNPDANLLVVKKFLDRIVVIPVTSECGWKYSEIKIRVVRKFAPKDKSQRYKISMDRLGFNENDLWIAAVAQANNLTLVSADRDFQRLREAGVTDLNPENW